MSQSIAFICLRGAVQRLTANTYRGSLNAVLSAAWMAANQLRLFRGTRHSSV